MLHVCTIYMCNVGTKRTYSVHILHVHASPTVDMILDYVHVHVAT